MHLKKKPILTAAFIVIFTALFILGSYTALRTFGKNQLRKKTDIPDRPIQYQGKLYTYNENLLTFLIMGIDKGKEFYEPWEAELENSANGQADALFLAVLNTDNKTISVISINRNTMTDIYDCDNTESSIPTFRAQIALQHAYGANTKVGCEYQQKAVQNLFYNLPIHGYVAINVIAVPTLNDLVGGVEVEVLEDLTPQDPNLIAGRRVHLMGESAYWYVKYRNIHQFASVDMRSKRQAQYLNGFIDAAKQTAGEDPLRLLQIYKELSPQMDTDISASQIIYLTSILPQCHFDKNKVYHIPGETVMGERYEEFYPNEDALLTLILDIFYKEVEEN